MTKLNIRDTRKGRFKSKAEGLSEPPEIHQMDFGASDRLSDFTDNYVFFTPAIAYIKAGFTDGHLGQFLFETKSPAKFMARRFDKPLFSGLATGIGDVSWNYTLWGIEKDHWRAFEAWVLSVCLMKTRTLFGVQWITILDPLFVDKHTLLPAAPPKLTINAFGVRKDADVFAFKFGVDYNTRPRMSIFEGDQTVSQVISEFSKGL